MRFRVISLRFRYERFPEIHNLCWLPGPRRHTKARLLEEKTKRLEKKMRKKHSAPDTPGGGPLLVLEGKVARGWRIIRIPFYFHNSFSVQIACCM